MEAEFTIGHLARATGCKVTTIRYYEEIGLLPRPRRSAGNTRLYEPPHAVRLVFIRHCRELGFSQAAIRGLLDLTDYPDRPCEAVAEIARTHLDEVNGRLSRLMALREELERMISACKGGQIGQCKIIETLSGETDGCGPTNALYSAAQDRA